jgi:hypothetical protein
LKIVHTAGTTIAEKKQCSAIPIDEIISLSWYENSWKRVTNSAGGNDAKMASMEEI